MYNKKLRKFVKTFSVSVLSLGLVFGAINAPIFAPQSVYATEQAKVYYDDFTVVDLKKDGKLSDTYLNSLEAAFKQIFNIGSTDKVLEFMCAKQLDENGLTVMKIPADDHANYDINNYWTEDGVRMLQITSKKAKKNDRALVMYHGGAAAIGLSWSTHGGVLKAMADKGYDVYAVDYHTTKEYKKDGTAYNYKDITEEGLKAYLHVLKKYKANSIDMWGDSYGGNLALATDVQLMEKNIGQPANIMLVSPWLNLASASESYTVNYESDVLFCNDFLEVCSALYADGDDAMKPEISPYYASYIKAKSNFHFVAGTTERLLSDTIDTARKLRKLGKNVEVTLFEDVMHDIASQTGLGVYEADEVYRCVTKFMDTVPQGEKQNPYWIDMGGSYWG